MEVAVVHARHEDVFSDMGVQVRRQVYPVIREAPVSLALQRKTVVRQ